MSKTRWTAQEKIVIDPGFQAAYSPPAKPDEPAPIEAEQSRLATLKKGQRVQPRRVVVQRKATAQGIGEGELIKALQRVGVGRPSTYAQIAADLVRRRYAQRNEKGQLIPTTRGKEACAFLLGAYGHIFTPAFTAQLERKLKAIAAGKASYAETIQFVWEQVNKTKETEGNS
jgi:DNA topoisomerase IA